jgi:hypothetical protein
VRLNGVNAVSEMWEAKIETRLIRCDLPWDGKAALYVAGPLSAFDGLAEELEALAGRCDSIDDFLWQLAPLLHGRDLTLTEMIYPSGDRGVTHRLNLAQQLHLAARFSSAHEAITIIIGVFQGASEAELTELAQSRDLIWVRQFLDSVLRDLDEESWNNRRLLSELIGSPWNYLLVDMEIE